MENVILTIKANIGDDTHTLNLVEIPAKDFRAEMLAAYVGSSAHVWTSLNALRDVVVCKDDEIIVHYVR